VEWQTVDASNWNPVTPGQTAGYNLLPASALQEYTSPTVIRIVGRVNVCPEPYLQLNEKTIFAFGIITTPDVTITTSDYDPLSIVNERDWMMLKFGGHFYTDNNNNHHQWWDLDIQVSRKVNKNQDLSFYIANSVLSSVDIVYQLGMRVLIKD